MIQSILIFSMMIFVLSACGVKGDPIPPSKPIEIDDGNPFKNQHFDDDDTVAPTPSPTASPSPTPKAKKGKKK